MGERHELHPTREQAWKLAAEDARFYRICLKRFAKFGAGHEHEFVLAKHSLVRSIFHLLFAWGPQADDGGGTG